jgi:hypothetical protein
MVLGNSVGINRVLNEYQFPVMHVYFCMSVSIIYHCP